MNRGVMPFEYGTLDSLEIDARITLAVVAAQRSRYTFDAFVVIARAAWELAVETQGQVAAAAGRAAAREGKPRRPPRGKGGR